MPLVTITLSSEEPSALDVQTRLREVIEDLDFRSVAEAERAAGIHRNQLYSALNAHRPLPTLLARIAKGWGIRSAVFFLTREEAAPLMPQATPQAPSTSPPPAPK